MARKTKTSTLVAPSFVDFEPLCERQKEEGTETLIIHLPDFKKDQLRVQVNTLGVLKVSGERRVDGANVSRFLKETTIPQGCDINDIRAKLKNSRLHITMPKKVPISPQVHQEEKHPLVTSEDTQNLKADSLVPNDQKLKAPITGNGEMGTTESDNKLNDNMFGLGRSLAKLGIDKRVAVNIGIAIAMVAIGAYVAYNGGSDASSSSPPTHIEELMFD